MHYVFLSTVVTLRGAKTPGLDLLLTCRRGCGAVHEFTTALTAFYPISYAIQCLIQSWVSLMETRGWQGQVYHAGLSDASAPGESSGANPALKPFENIDNNNHMS